MPEKGEKLRRGFTTGTAAAAAVKAALIFLFSQKKPASVTIPFLSEGCVDIAVYRLEQKGRQAAECTVIKDAGDDPDITHNAEIGAFVALVKAGSGRQGNISITGGKGVGRVTRPGLEVPEGESAINSGPLKMIRMAVADALSISGQKASDYDVSVEIFVPEGEKLAEKTLNRRLGIIGGISILGTTGIVKPLSHEAYISTIKSSLSVASAMKHDTVVLTTGRRSERFAQVCFPEFAGEVFIQIGDFFSAALSESARLSFKQVFLAVFFGKALKMAQGFPHTHAGKSELTMKWLAKRVEKITGDRALSERTAGANTARHAFSFLAADRPEVISFVGEQVVRSADKFTGKALQTDCIIFDFDGEPVFRSDKDMINGR